ncbi:MAG TPA: lipase family protein [Steroidobacteraceae bacterium]|nr:lipase family protein [Steroidobacteraceae bacterium]
MTSIGYDSSRAALYSPEKSETVFQTACSYSHLQTAVECARLSYFRVEESELEYQRLTEALGRVGFDRPTLFVDAATGTEAFATRRANDGTALIAFRGTQPDDFTDIATDLNAMVIDWPESAGRAHSGFAQAARAVLRQIRQWLEKDSGGHRHLTLTGHSLGAAIATLIASVVRPSLLVTLGSPRVGDQTFANSLNDIDIVRIVNCCDAVTEVPPELHIYTHVSPPFYITRDGTTIQQAEEAMIKADRLQARVEYLAQHALKKGSVLIRDLADHAPINYVRAFFR